MNVTKRAFIFGLALTLGGRNAFAGRPTTFDFYEYVRNHGFQQRSGASIAPIGKFGLRMSLRPQSGCRP